MRIRRALFAASAILLVAATPACSGSSNENTVTKAEYGTKANRICDEHSAQTQKIPQPTDASDTNAAAEYLNRTADIQADQVAELRKLERPAGDDDELAAIFDRTDEIVEQQRTAARALQQRKPEAQQLLAALAKDIRADNVGYDGYGMKRCGSEQVA
jgi:hypothetical protein